MSQTVTEVHNPNLLLSGEEVLQKVYDVLVYRFPPEHPLHDRMIERLNDEAPSIEASQIPYWPTSVGYLAATIIGQTILA